MSLTEQKVNKHPVYDFLTVEMIELLKNIKNKKNQNALTIFYSSGGSGKTTFLNILNNVFKCKVLSISSVKGYVMNERNKDELKNYDVIILQEFEHGHINTILEPQFIEKLSSLGKRSNPKGLHVITQSNCIPKDFKSKVELLKNNDYSVRVIRFEYEYCQDAEAELQRISTSGKNSQYMIKQSLNNYDIVNEEAFRIIREIVAC